MYKYGFLVFYIDIKKPSVSLYTHIEAAMPPAGLQNQFPSYNLILLFQSQIIDMSDEILDYYYYVHMYGCNS